MINTPIRLKLILQKIGTERLASPLILKTFNTNQKPSLALRLCQQNNEETGDWLELKKESTDVTLEQVGSSLNSSEAKRIEPLNGETDPITAFLKELILAK